MSGVRANSSRASVASEGATKPVSLNSVDVGVRAGALAQPASSSAAQKLRQDRICMARLRKACPSLQYRRAPRPCQSKALVLGVEEVEQLVEQVGHLFGRQAQ